METQYYHQLWVIVESGLFRSSFCVKVVSNIYLFVSSSVRLLYLFFKVELAFVQLILKLISQLFKGPWMAVRGGLLPGVKQ